MSKDKVFGPEALPTTLDQLSGEKQRGIVRNTAFDTSRLVGLGTVVLIQEPSAELVAFRRWLNHSANADIAEVAASRVTMNAVIHTVAAYVGYVVASAATDQDFVRIMGDLATALQRRAGGKIIIG